MAAPSLTVLILSQSVPTSDLRPDSALFYKSVLLAAKNFVAARNTASQLQIHLCLEPETRARLQTYVDNWFPRSVQITDALPGSELQIVAKLQPLTVCFLFNESTLCLPEGVVLGFDAVNQCTLGTYLLLVDDTTSEPEAAEVRVLAQRHFKSLSKFPFVPQAMVCRALTLASDWAKIHSEAEQPLLRLLSNRTLYSAMPSLALNNTKPQPLTVPWQKVAELVQSQN
jgi:hypothetical protein